jgi:hypothetical protein
MQSRILPSSAGSILPRWTLNTHLERSMELVFQHWDGFCLLTENKQNKEINAINIHKFTSFTIHWFIKNRSYQPKGSPHLVM